MADTSAWARAGAREVAPQWRELVKAGELVACAPVTMEMIFDTFTSQWVAPAGSID